MNKLEEKYANYLEGLKVLGEIEDYKYEPIALRLARRTTYTPDFMVMLLDGTLEFHETKGFWEEDARVKIKVAANMFPFRFLAIKEKPKKSGGGWDIEEIKPI